MPDTNCPRCGNAIEPDLQDPGEDLICEGGAAPCGKTWERA